MVLHKLYYQACFFLSFALVSLSCMPHLLYGKLVHNVVVTNNAFLITPCCLALLSPCFHVACNTCLLAPP